MAGSRARGRRGGGRSKQASRLHSSGHMKNLAPRALIAIELDTVVGGAQPWTPGGGAMYALHRAKAEARWAPLGRNPDGSVVKPLILSPGDLVGPR